MKKILIINANYYNDITSELVKSAIKILKKKKFKRNIIFAPGAFETPFIVRRNIKKFDGFLVIGCIIKGDTPHFNFICKSTFDSLQKLSIKYNKPITNGIITALNKKQAYQRCGKLKSSKLNKGIESANALISVLLNDPKKV